MKTNTVVTYNGFSKEEVDFLIWLAESAMKIEDETNKLILEYAEIEKEDEDYDYDDDYES